TRDPRHPRQRRAATAATRRRSRSFVSYGMAPFDSNAALRRAGGPWPRGRCTTLARDGPGGKPARLIRWKRMDLAATFRALRHPNFRLFFAGQLVSLTGTWMQSVAQ